MIVNCFSLKRGCGKTKRAIELCKTYISKGKKVLLLVKNHSEINRINDIFIKEEYEELSKIDMVPFTTQYLQRIIGKKYVLIVIDECFEMSLDAQANFLEDMVCRNPDCTIIGFGTEVRRKTFRDFTVDTIGVWEPSEESKEIIKNGGFKDEN